MTVKGTLKIEVLKMNPFSNNVTIHVPNEGSVRVPESRSDENEQENPKSSLWNGIAVKEETQNKYLDNNEGTGISKRKRKKTHKIHNKNKIKRKEKKTDIIDDPNLSTGEPVVNLPEKLSKEPIEKNEGVGRWNDVSVKINTPKKYIPKKYQTPSNPKGRILNIVSKIFSAINERFYFSYKTSNEISAAINYNNVAEFTKILKNMKAELTSYNNACIKKHQGSGQKSHHESLCNVTVNNKPILYALAESGSPEILEILCSDTKMAPRAWYAEPVYGEKDTIIANTIIEGELNKKDWWCYSGSPLNYALDAGNIDAAKVLISYDANIVNCKASLEKIPREIKMEFFNILQKRHAIILSHMESQTNVVDILEKLTEKSKLDSGLKIEKAKINQQIEKEKLITQVESKLEGITLLMFKSEISKMKREKNLKTFKNNLLQSLNVLQEIIKRNIADQKMLQNMI